MKIHPIFQYLISRDFFKNLAIAVGSAIVLFILVFISLRIYTDHGEAFSVPDFTGMEIEDVAKLAEQKHLKYEVFDSVYLFDFEKGTVVEQYPVPGFKVKKYRKIYLTMNAVSPEKTVMPNLVGHTLRQARSIMENYGLKIGELSYVYDIGKNVILEQKFNDSIITPGDTLIKGSAIDFVLGKGLGHETVPVPDLINLTVDEAKVKAADRFLKLGAIVPDPEMEDSDTLLPRIWKQRPVHNKGQMLPLGSTIDVWYTTDSTKLTVPDSLDMYVDESETRSL